VTIATLPLSEREGRGGFSWSMLLSEECDELSWS